MRILDDVRQALRTLAKQRAFALVALPVMALGIGAAAAVFSVVHGVLLRPLPYPHAERLVVASLSVPEYRDLERLDAVFEATALWASNLYTIGGDAQGAQLLGAVVTPGFFPMLGHPLFGRSFEPADDLQPLAILSHALWRGRFGGDPAVLGRSVRLGGAAHTVIGVMPPEFELPGPQFELWVTFGSSLARTPGQAENRLLRIFRAVGRLRSGVPLERAQASVDALSARLEREHPDTNAGFRIRLDPLRERLVGGVRPALMLLVGIATLLVFIAAANVANLQLARGVARAREMAIRSALGASRARLARQLLVESAVLGCAAGALGTLAALGLLELLPRLLPADFPRVGSVAIDMPALGFVLVVSLLAGAAAGIIPALEATRTHPSEALGAGMRSGGAAGGRVRRARRALVVVETALATVVLVGAGLLTRSFIELRGVDAGFAAENLWTANLVLVEFQDPGRRAALVRETLAALEQIPGVSSAGGATGLPAVTPQRAIRFTVEGKGNEPSASSAYFIAATPAYFRTLQTPLHEGRSFDARDTAGAPKVVILNRRLARRLFPTGDAIGRRLRLVNPDEGGAPWREIVGVVGDVRYRGLDDPGEATIYTPFEQTPFIWNYLFVRTRGDERAFLASAAAAVARVAPSLELASVQTMEAVVSQSLARPRSTLLLVGSFAVLALALAAAGVFAVVSYSVAQRTHEFGVRTALGAAPSDLSRLALREGASVSAAGIVIGSAAALAASRVLRRLLFGVTSSDPWTYAAIAALVALVTILASYLPARRAARVDPLVALRDE